MQGRVLRFLMLGASLAALLLLVPAAQGGHAAILKLEVSFSYTDEITVSLPNGSPVGTTSGSPTVLPAGYYTVTLTQAGCVDTSAFVLQGPGVNIIDDLQAGEQVTNDDVAVLQPNSTYTWRNGGINPPVVHTFVTSGDVLGTAPPPSSSAAVTLSKNKEANSSVVGSSIARTAIPVRGSLSGAVSAKGKLALAYKGENVTSLTAGRYKLTVADSSKTSGFTLAKASQHPLAVTGNAFAGQRSITVDLTAGKWLFEPGLPGPKTYFTVVAHKRSA